MGKIKICGRRQVVRRQPSKLIFVGSSPIARSKSGARSSAAERTAHNRLVVGSNPTGPISVRAIHKLE